MRDATSAAGHAFDRCLFVGATRIGVCLAHQPQFTGNVAAAQPVIVG